MAERFTKSMARNIYLGGSVFFILVFLGLTFDTMTKLPARDHRADMTEGVVRGKLVWEQNNCIGCHTLLGEGAYYAPELGNVFNRRGGKEAFPLFLNAWMKAQPSGVPGRRQMPQFNLTDEQISDMAEFLEFSANIETNNWPPNIEG